MSRIAPPILLSEQERITLQTWARARSQAQRVVQRAQILLLAADGVESQEIAERLLVLWSLCETCKYMGIDFLDFLRSGEKDLHAFENPQRRRRNVFWGCVA